MQNEKDFDKWNNLKKLVSLKPIVNAGGEILVDAKKKDLWWCHVGLNIGSEEYGKNVDFERPVVILTRLSPSTYLAAPTTSKFKDNKYRIKISTHDGKFCYALIDQIKVIDVRRLKRKIGVILDLDFTVVCANINKFMISDNCEIPLARDFSEPFGTVDKSITPDQNLSSDKN